MIPRRKPLARSPFRRPTARSALVRRTRLATMSERRRGMVDERRLFVTEVLHARPWCEGCDIIGYRRVARSTDVHELTRRSQGSPIVPSMGLRPEDVLALCRRCHTWVTENPAMAVGLGLARWSWQGTDEVPGGESKGG